VVLLAVEPTVFASAQSAVLRLTVHVLVLLESSAPATADVGGAVVVAVLWAVVVVVTAVL